MRTVSSQICMQLQYSMCSKHAHMDGRLSDKFHPPLIPRHAVWTVYQKHIPSCDLYSGYYNLSTWLSGWKCVSIPHDELYQISVCFGHILIGVHLRNWSMRLESPSTVRSGDMIRSCKGLLSLARFPSPLDRWITLFTQHRGIDRDVWIHDISTSRSDTRGK